jgi:hypothetical protein
MAPDESEAVERHWMGGNLHPAHSFGADSLVQRLFSADWLAVCVLASMSQYLLATSPTSPHDTWRSQTCIWHYLQYELTTTIY